ncbi:hypothetical protein MTR_0024s0180 [Medicago truncatula]|uniref:Uncharacterized protein n=1 Tax=Medicago truncatula TaxID=3880 RepID=A0A072TJF1_MEDTR|nr:hypothetical protein MTR_0024s0180 [Medicago truncatula]
MDVRVKRSAKRRSHSGALLINWWHLKGEKQRIFQHKILKGCFMQPQGSAKDMWEKMAHEIKEVAKQRWKIQEILDLEVKNFGGGMTMFKVKLESKEIISKTDLGVKMSKLGVNIRYIGKRLRRW